MKTKYVVKKKKSHLSNPEPKIVKTQSTLSPSLSTPLPPEVAPLKTTGTVGSAGIESFDSALNRISAETGKSLPKKRGRKSNAEKLALGLGAKESQAGSLNNPGSTTGTAPNAGATFQPLSMDALEAQAKLIPDFVVTPFLKMPFTMAAKKTGFKGFALDADEEASLVPQVKLVAAKWLPILTGQNSPEVMLLSSVVAIVGMKYMMYQEWASDQTARERETRFQNSHAANPEFPQVQQ